MTELANIPDFLSAKLNPQRVTRQLINRRTVVEGLQRHPYPKLSTLIAPAGYGKSTLLYQLMKLRQSQGELVAWLSLDDNDNNPSVFSSYLLSAIHQAYNDSEVESSLAIEKDLQNANPKEKITFLFGLITASDKPITVVLDDFHVLHNEKLIALMEWILISMPLNLCFVIGSRTELPLRILSDLRAKSNLLEVSSQRLEFTLEECYSLSNNVNDQETEAAIDQALIEKLYTKTEGWAAALQLAFLALRNSHDQEKFVEDFSGTDRDIVSYLASCVILDLDEETRHFMMQTSILERMNGELAVLLTGNSLAAEKLLELERAGLFLYAIDRAGKWYRYHHLFRDFLRTQLKDQMPAIYTSLYKKAADWFANSGRIDEAVGYYLNGSEYTLAADLIAKRAPLLVQYQGHHETLFNWLKDLPEGNILDNSAIMVSYLWSLTFTRCFKQIDPLLESFEKNKASKGCSTTNPDYLNYSLEMIGCVRDCLSGRQTLARDKSANWLEQWQDAPQFERGTVLGVLGASCLHTLEFKLARRVLTQASEEFHQCQAEYGVAWMDSVYAHTCMRQGFLIEAKEVLERSILRSNDLMGEFSFASAMLSLGLGHVHYELNELELAESLIKKGFLYIEDHGLPDATVTGYITRARLFLSQDDPDKAIETLRQGERFGREQDIQNFSFALMLERGRIYISQGLIIAPQAIHDDFYDLESKQQHLLLSPYEQMLFDIYQVRLHIALGEFEEAFGRIKVLIVDCNRQKFFPITNLCLILQASILEKSNEHLKAMRSLEKAISNATPEMSIRLFIDENDHIVNLLPALAKAYAVKSDDRSRQQEALFVDQLLVLLKHRVKGNVRVSKKPKASNSGETIVDALTKREQQILSLLRQGLTNQELSDALFISLATTKWHLSNIYSKLGVKNKIQAIRISNRVIKND